MKACTDLPQSKKLTEILPIESADMCFNISVRKNMPPLMIPYSKFDEFFSISPTPDFLIPCWSLVALLGVLPDYTLQTNTDGTVFVVCDSKKPMISDAYDNPVDACVEMILKLKEENHI